MNFQLELSEFPSVTNYGLPCQYGDMNVPRYGSKSAFPTCASNHRRVRRMIVRRSRRREPAFSN